ncbi:ComEC/Rec2 family competence protein [Roseibacillus ishigakijimensis]|uniref:ComEC/Rec2 family competence protein n=1 Tax=Roseibacillus ishigakijimensis TaxID=454146 RepID=A0A934VNI0_9BACT|nr:ComEC/Rec2 family competence protein [Roseibacillus ishigakijimensis]MBK1835322.1 ComEC/Rec2 family competence protein [Roseibacillus ishigakijimensis]
MGGILAAELALWPLLVGAIVGSLYQGLYRRQPVWVMAALTLLTSALLHQSRVRARADLAAVLASQGHVTLTGTLVESNRTGLLPRLFRTDQGGLVRLHGLPEDLRTGQRLTLSGQPFQAREKRNPTGWDPEQTLWKKGLAGSLFVTGATPQGWSRGLPRLRGWAEAWRAHLATRVTTGISSPTAAEVVRAVILGEKTASSEAFQDFRKTGTMHIFAVSGLHVGLVALLVYGVGRFLRLPPRALLLTVLAAMFGYAFITGLRPPALRAALMGALLLGRFLLLRRPAAFNNLCAAALVVLACDSFQLWQPGFQFSFLVVLVILLLEPFLWQRVEPHLGHDPYLPRPLWSPWQKISSQARSQAAKMFTVSLTAWGGSAPLSALYFGWFTPVAALASAFMVLFAFAILAGAFLSLAVGLLHPSAALPINALNGHLADWARSSATGFSRLPGAWTRVTSPAPWQNGLCLFDLPYEGTASHLAIGGGILIDGGRAADFQWIVQPALEASSLSCDSLIASHNDANHLGGLTASLAIWPIRQILHPPEPPSYELANLQQAARNQGTRLLPARAKQWLPLAKDVSCEVLATGTGSPGRADDRSLILRLHWQGWRLLFTHEAGYETESRLLAAGLDLSADVWICGAQSALFTGHDAFLAHLGPRLIITPRPAPPLSPSRQKWLQQSGITLFGKQEHGAIFLLPSANTLTARGYLSGEEFTLPR